MGRQLWNMLTKFQVMSDNDHNGRRPNFVFVSGGGGFDNSIKSILGCHKRQAHWAEIRLGRRKFYEIIKPEQQVFPNRLVRKKSVRAGHIK
jgi:hypothetical protein